MSEFRGSQWLIILAIYWIIYFLLLTSYVKSINYVDSCISYSDTGMTNFQDQRFVYNNNLQDLSIASTIMASAKFAFGFDTSYYCLKNANWIMVLFFSWLPFFITMLAIWMLFKDVIIVVMQKTLEAGINTLKWIGSIIAWFFI